MKRLKRLIRHATPEQLNDFQVNLNEMQELVDLRRRGVHLVNAGEGSVYLYFWCRTREAVQCLMEWIDSGQLASTIEQLINLATAGEEKLAVSCLLVKKKIRTG